MITKNKKAYFLYEILQKYIAGIVLLGSEVKSIRKGEISLKESYIYIKKGEVFLKNCYIKEYKDASYNNHEVRRERKLLLNKTEITKLEKHTKDKGITIIPLSMFFKNGNIKIEIALAKGKKLYDKRQSLKQKDDKRTMDRIMKQKKR